MSYNNYELMELDYPAEAIRKSSEMKTKHGEVKELRNNLDKKMRELYNDDLNDVTIEYNSVLYTNLAFTILGTTLLYFVFVKK